MFFLARQNRLICYQDSGEEFLPVLVLAHPLGMNKSVWNRLCDLLHGHYRCIRWDLPGHGGSGNVKDNVTLETLTQDVLALMDAKNISTFSFFGSSFGGFIGQSLLQKAPNRLERVWLTNIGVEIENKEKLEQHIQQIRASGLSAEANSIISHCFTNEFATNNPQLLAGWSAQFERTHLDSYIQLCNIALQVDYREQLKDYPGGVQLFAGQEDSYVSMQAMQDLCNALQDARLTIEAGVGHLPAIENPRVLIDLIKSTPERADIATQGISYDVGLARRQTILGKSHVAKASQAATSLDMPFQQFITRNAWGELWGNQDLTVQQRSMITLGILAALGRDGELVLHLKTAHRLGLTEEQLRQVLMHVAIYAGVPAANHAFKLAKENQW